MDTNTNTNETNDNSRNDNLVWHLPPFRIFSCVCVCVWCWRAQSDKFVVFVWHVSRAKMSSNTDDTNLLAQNNLIYNSFDWKPITFTHVEYPKGKRLVYVQFRFRLANCAEMFGPAAGLWMHRLDTTHSHKHRGFLLVISMVRLCCVDNFIAAIVKLQNKL